MTATKIFIPKTELNLKYTLTGGQSFRWSENGGEKYIGVFAHKLWTLWREEEYILYKVRKKVDDFSDAIDHEMALKNYFRLDVSLEKLYEKWAANDVTFDKISKHYPGIRLLRQDIFENTISFMCSSNNNIPRITSMIENLCCTYGDFICEYDGKEYFDFPSVDKLVESGVEESLRKMAFGYRARYLNKSVCLIAKTGFENWSQQVGRLPYQEAKAALMKLPGVGPKVADCICLMSLNHMQVVPVDTHIAHLASSIYMLDIPAGNVSSKKNYIKVAQHFQNIFGDTAGWAHLVLFCSDLKSFETTAFNNSKGKKRKTN